MDLALACDFRVAARSAGFAETYAQQADALKATVRDAFKRDWSESQYKLFETWQMDPTDISIFPTMQPKYRWIRIPASVLLMAQNRP